MKKKEKVIVAALTIALGVLLIVLKGDIISILMTVVGLGLVVLGILDLVERQFPPAVVKIVVGIVVIVCGWVIVKAVLYVLSAVLLIAGILLLYERIKSHGQCGTTFQTVCGYAVPVLCILIGILLLFNQGNTVAWVFVISGICTVVEGGLLLADALLDD